jgi:hypothetical protein
MSAAKWLYKIAESRFARPSKARTPIPPKPYVDTGNVAKHMKDPRYFDPHDLKNIDPEKPQWDDPRFETKESKPFFDIFGMNRDWSWSIFKFSSLFVVVLLYQEMRLAAFANAEGIDARLSQTANVSSVPDFARDNKATEEELREAGFAFVGVKKLDSLGALDPKRISVIQPPAASEKRDKGV